MYRHPSLQTRTPIRPYNEERQAKLFERHFHSKEFVAWVQRHACSIPGCERFPVEAAHARSRAAGGRWTDVLPLCRDHHREQHDLGVATFEGKYGISLSAFALRTSSDWSTFTGGGV